eukprot:658066-Rhodomonas_salina.1
MQLEQKEGEALLNAAPVYPKFWQHVNPYVEPRKRGQPQPDPMKTAVSWNPALFTVSPELLLVEEWEAVETESTEQLEEDAVKTVESFPGQLFWIPSPAYKGVPILPNTVPEPVGELKEVDARTAFGVGLWGKDSAIIYKALSKLISCGFLSQTRSESGLLFTMGPRMIIGNLLYEADKPVAYLTGDGYDLVDEEAVMFARRFIALVKGRGVLWVAAGRYGKYVIAPYLANQGADKEDVWTFWLRTHLELELGHFSRIMQHVLSTNPFTQILSPQTGGIYILSESEQKRRMELGVTDE